jgi:hypothetical protein
MVICSMLVHVADGIHLCCIVGNAFWLISTVHLEFRCCIKLAFWAPSEFLLYSDVGILIMHALFNTSTLVIPVCFLEHHEVRLTIDHLFQFIVSATYSF